MTDEADIQPETTRVKTQILNKLLELSNAMLHGDYSRRMLTDFDDEVITKIADNLNRFADKAQLNAIGEDYNQEQTITTFIEVISSFANLDFKQKLPISENGTIMDAIATGINILGAAFIATNPVSALFANIFIKTQKDFQAKFFSNKEDAFDWIIACREKVRSKLIITRQS